MVFQAIYNEYKQQWNDHLDLDIQAKINRLYGRRVTNINENADSFYSKLLDTVKIVRYICIIALPSGLITGSLGLGCYLAGIEELSSLAIIGAIEIGISLGSLLFIRVIKKLEARNIQYEKEQADAKIKALIEAGTGFGSDCAICYDHVDKPEALYRPGCSVHCSKNNPIHEACLKEWQRKKDSCPSCRAPSPLRALPLAA